MTASGEQPGSGTKTEVRFAGGEVDLVRGDTDSVAKALSDAARSGHSRLAWLELDASGERIAVNPAHVMSLREPGAS